MVRAVFSEILFHDCSLHRHSAETLIPTFITGKYTLRNFDHPVAMDLIRVANAGSKSSEFRSKSKLALVHAESPFHLLPDLSTLIQGGKSTSAASPVFNICVNSWTLVEFISRLPRSAHGGDYKHLEIS